MAYNNCLTVLPNYVLLAECEYVKSGISGIGIFLDSAGVVDYSDEDEWNAALTANTAKVIGGCDKGVRIEIPTPTEETIDNPSGCSEQPLLTGFSFVANVEDANVTSQNDTFYSQLATARDITIVPYFCDQDIIRVIDHDVLAYSPSMPTVDFSNKVIQKYIWNFKWFTPAGDLAGTWTNPPDNIFC